MKGALVAFIMWVTLGTICLLPTLAEGNPWYEAYMMSAFVTAISVVLFWVGVLCLTILDS